MAEDPPNTNEAKTDGIKTEAPQGGAQTPVVKPEPSKPSPKTKADIAEAAARKSKFEDFLRFLKRRHFPNEYITKTVSEHVVKRLKMENTDLWKQVNERFQRDPTRRKIFIRGIDFTAKDDEMEMVFSQFGTVERLNLMRQADNRSKGFGFIMYKTDYGAQAAVAQKTVTYKNREMQISAAIPEHLKEKKIGRGGGPTAMMGRGMYGGGFRGGYGRGFGGYGRGFGMFRGFYGGAFPYFGRGRGVPFWAPQWPPVNPFNKPIQNYYTPPPPTPAVAAASDTLQSKQQPAAAGGVVPFTPYSSITDPGYTQRYTPAAGAFKPNIASNSNASEQAAHHYNASVTYGSAAAYYAQAATQTHLTQPLGTVTQLGQIVQPTLQPTVATATPYQMYSF